MAQPQAYNREVDFTERDGDDTNHAGINAELDAAALSINQIRDNLALIQRDDGGLQNGIVTAESLAPSAFDAVLANVNEAVQDAQTAAGQATLAATTAIDARDDAQAAETAAETAAAAASLNATTSVTKAAEALASATSAAASASTATTKAAEASASATAAAASATSAAGSATTATTKASEASTSAAAALASQNAAATSATNAAASASSALASLNDFKGRYYGPLASDPTQDPLGNAPTAGDLYFNTGTNRLRVFNATTSTWNEGNAGSVAVQNFSGTGLQTAFALAAAPESENNTQVYISGVYQQKTEYSISGTTLTFTSAPPAGTNNIEVVTMNTLPLGVTSDDLVQTAPEPGGLWSTVRGFITWMKGRWDALTSSVGSSLVGFIQSGAGAVATTVQGELRRMVHVKQYGAASDGVTDDAAAVNAAITAAAALGGGDVLLPAGTTLVGSTIYVAENVRLVGAGQKATTIKLKASSNVNIIEQKAGAKLGFGLFDLTVDGNQANNTQGGVYLVGVQDERGPCWQIERVRITKCRNSVMASGVKAAFYIGGNTWHVIRDLEVFGNDFAQIAYWHGAADSKVDGVYLGTNGYSFGSTAYGLFVTSAGNFFNNCYFGGTQPGPQIYFTGASASANKFVGCIVDNAGKNGVHFFDGASSNQFIGCQIGNSSYSDGGTYYLVRNDVTNGKNMFVGVKFYSYYNTAPATHGYFESAGVSGAAVLVGCEFDGTWVTSAVSVPGASTTQFVGCKGYDITNVGTLKASTRVNVEGPYPSSAPSTSSVPLGRFNGGGALSLWAGTYAYSYVWLQAIQDDGSNNLKNLYLNPLGGGVTVGGNLVPTTDNTVTLGAAGARWSVVYAGNGTINTSDQREKQDIAAFDAAELRVAVALKGLVKKFRFKDAVTAKGDSARIHIGVIAQEVISAFQAEGLDPMRYGIVCYDEWDDKYEDVYDDEGKPTGKQILVTAAGNRYGIRYDQLLAFIIAST